MSSTRTKMLRLFGAVVTGFTASSRSFKLEAPRWHLGQVQLRTICYAMLTFFISMLTFWKSGLVIYKKTNFQLPLYKNIGPT